jgi:tetratricopeptide (TPR) repeat protein
VNGDAGAGLESMAEAMTAFMQAGDRRNACVARTNLGFLYSELGLFGEAEEALQAALSLAERLELRDTIASVMQNLGLVLARRGQLEPARSMQEAAILRFEGLGSPRLEGVGRIYLAQILVLAGDLEAGEREARTAAELLKSAPPLRAYALASHGLALLRLGRTEEALGAACDALSLLESVGAEEGESLVRLIYAEALGASGRQAEAAEAIAEARRKLLERAAKISDAAWRERFLRRVPDNVRTLELAQRWLR